MVNSINVEAFYKIHKTIKEYFMTSKHVLDLMGKIGKGTIKTNSTIILNEMEDLNAITLEEVFRGGVSILFVGFTFATLLFLGEIATSSSKFNYLCHQIKHL